MALRMRFPFSLKTGAIVVVAAVALVAVGIYAGYFYAERLGIKRELSDSVLRTALNLQVIGSIRGGKATDAIDLLNSMNETNLIYLKQYDDTELTNAEFVRRKKKVLTALSKEWADHPRKESPFKSDPEWQQHQRDLENYLKQNQSEKPASSL